MAAATAAVTMVAAAVTEVTAATAEAEKATAALAAAGPTTHYPLEAEAEGNIMIRGSGQWRRDKGVQGATSSRHRG